VKKHYALIAVSNLNLIYNKLTFFIYRLYLYYMGRKSYNRTYEEILELKRVRANHYYKLNREMINQKRRSDYQRLKTGNKNK